MKNLIRNYVLNFVFFPLLLLSALSAAYIYTPDHSFAAIRFPAILQMVSMVVFSVTCMFMVFALGHLGVTVSRIEEVRTEQLASSLGEDTRDKVFNIFLNRGPSKLSDFNPEPHYVAAGVHAGFGLLLPLTELLLFRSSYHRPWMINTLTLTILLNTVVFWIRYNVFRNYMNNTLRIVKRLSDRCLYYSNESLRRSQIFNTITEVVRIFNEEQDLESVFRRILTDSTRLLDLEVGVMEVYLEELSDGMRRVIAPDENAIDLDDDFCELVISRSEVHNNLELSRLFKPLADQGYFSMLHVSLEVRGKDVGYMAGFSKKRRELRDADLDFFYAFGRQASMVIENAYLLEKVKILSVTDGLTGLRNRRYFREAIVTEVRRAVRYGKSLCVVMIDIDHFKHYNDTNGHPAGDRVLQKVATILRELTRDTDIVARYGGEEFVLVLTETTKEGGAEFARRLCTVVEKEDFENEEAQPGGQVTISVGVAACSDDSTEADQLVSLADQALYRAKNTGRNRVVVYEKGNI